MSAHDLPALAPEARVPDWMVPEYDLWTSDECPAGGPHTWITDDTGDAYPTVRFFVRCDECGAQPAKEERDDY